MSGARDNEVQGLFARIVLLCHVEGAPLGRFTVPILTALVLANLLGGAAMTALFVALRRQGRS